MNTYLIEKPIHLPENPFWDVFKRFGRDEMIAMVLNVLGTFTITWIMVHFSGVWFYAGIIALSGPVVEKVGFFPAHFKDALDMYRTTPVPQRKALSTYFWIALKRGSVSLMEDILVHDPFYVVFMYAGLRFYSDTPPWILSIVSFVIALFIVATGEVAVHELRYLFRQWRLKNLGFEREKYYESRFFISSQKHPYEILHRMVKEFKLTVKETGEYEDIYYDTLLPGYSGREVKLRCRNRTVGGKEINSVQVVYKKTSELARTEISQFRFFPQEKHKFYLIRKPFSDLPKIKRWAVRGSEKVIRFKRTIARDYPNGLFVSIDDVIGENPYFVVELKVYKDLMLLKRAMRFIMTEFPVTQVTHGKEALV